LLISINNVIPLLFALGVALAFQTPAAPIQRRGDASFAGLLQQTANEAAVEIVDWEGMLAAGGQNVWLQKRDGRWRVIARETTWVS
jgi:hypothetical protein